MEVLKLADKKTQSCIGIVRLEDGDHDVKDSQIVIDINLLKHLLLFMEHENRDIGGIRLSVLKTSVGGTLLSAETIHQQEAGENNRFVVSPIVNAENDKVKDSNPTRKRDQIPCVTRKDLGSTPGLACIRTKSVYRPKKGSMFEGVEIDEVE